MKTAIVAANIVTHANAAHLNGSGSEKRGKATISAIKSFSHQGQTYPYISAQAMKKWMRNYVEEQTMMPNYYARIHKKTSNKLSKDSFIIDPINYIEDDLFGYSHPFFTNPNVDAGEKRLQIAAINRSAPFRISIMNPIHANYMISEDQGWIHMKRKTNLPYNTQYSTGFYESLAILDINRVGVFQNYGDIVELDPEYLKMHFKNGTLLQKNAHFELVNIEQQKKQAIALFFQALLNLNGGAKEPGYAADLSPRIIIAAGQQSAVPIFSQLFSTGYAHSNNELFFDQQKFFRVLKKFGHLLTTDIFIGYRNGTLTNESLIYELEGQSIATNNSSININFSSPGNTQKIIQQLEGTL